MGAHHTDGRPWPHELGALVQRARTPPNQHRPTSVAPRRLVGLSAYHSELARVAHGREGVAQV
jgi:hypothetical protein